MASYDSQKSKRRSAQSNPQSNPVSQERASMKGAARRASNQERGTGSAAGKAVRVPSVPADSNRYMGRDNNPGNQVRIGANVKGTSRLKQPSAIASASRDRVYVDPFQTRKDAGSKRSKK